MSPQHILASIMDMESATSPDDPVLDPEAPPTTAAEEASTAGQFNAKLMKHLSMSAGESSPLLSKPLLHLPTTRTNAEQQLGCSSLQHAWKWYEEQIEQRPLSTKCITAGIIVGLGDLTSQCLGLLRLSQVDTATAQASAVPGIDWYRSWAYFLLGLLLQGPISHCFYAKLDAALPPTPSPWSGTTIIKLMIDQLLFSPSFLLCVFLFLDTVQHGLSPTGMMHHIQRSYLSTLVTNWKLWTPATLINFVAVPPRYRVLFCNAVFFLWSIILSMLLN